MRMVICREGVLDFPTHIIDVGGLKWEDRDYPITGLNNNSTQLMGVARDIRRDGDIVSAEVEISNEDLAVLMEHKELGLTVYGGHLIEDNVEDGPRRITSLDLVCVFPSLGLPWVDEETGV